MEVDNLILLDTLTVYAHVATASSFTFSFANVSKGAEMISIRNVSMISATDASLLVVRSDFIRNDRPLFAATLSNDTLSNIGATYDIHNNLLVSPNYDGLRTFTLYDTSNAVKSVSMDIAFTIEFYKTKK